MASEAGAYMRAPAANNSVKSSEGVYVHAPQRSFPDLEQRGDALVIHKLQFTRQEMIQIWGAFGIENQYVVEFLVPVV